MLEWSVTFYDFACSKGMFSYQTLVKITMLYS